jgi:hypothetical protein
VSGGGKKTTTVNNDPWKPSQQYILEGLEGARGAYRNPPQYFPGQTFVGPTAPEMAAWGGRLGYMDQVFGGSQAPRFGDATGALSGALTGSTSLGSLAGGLAPFAGQQLMGGWNSQFGQAGGLDARQAINRMLSGQPDYQGLQGAIDAANAPILRQFQQDILPGLSQRASFLNNPTGGIKTLNRVLPELGERMAQNAQLAYQAERNRALADQAAAASLVSSGGLNQNQSLLGLGGLAGTLGAGATADQMRALALFPTIAQTGEAPGMLNQQFAQWGRGFQEQQLQDQLNRFNYYQNLPWQQAAQYMGTIMGSGGLGGTQTQRAPEGSRALGVAGGALAGAQLGSIVPGIGTGLGAILGGLGGLLF